MPFLSMMVQSREILDHRSMGKAMVPAEFQDKFGTTIHLTEERWHHIVSRHPEMERYYGEIFGTLKDPDAILKAESIPQPDYFIRRSMACTWLW